MSSRPTFSATLRHSRPTCSNQPERRKDQSSTGSTPSGANQFARLPAELLAEHRAERLQSIVARRGAQRPRRGAFLVGVVDGEDVGVRLLVLLHEVRPRRVVAEPSGIDPHHVDGRLALDDPFRELEAGAARRGNPEAVSLVEPEVVDAPRRAR